MIQHPESLYQSFQAGGDVKAFLLALHKRNTGGLKLDDIKREEIADMPTMMVPAIPKSPPYSTSKMIAAILAPGIYRDEEGRHCFKLTDVGAHTLEVVERAAEQFRRLTGQYPAEIIPCPSRYRALRFKDFCPKGNTPIPYTSNFVFPVDYDVLVRSGKP